MSAPLSSPIDLKNKRAVVIGGGGDIGKAIIKAFAREGAQVTIADIIDTSNIVQEIEQMGGKAFSYVSDVTNETQIDGLRDFVINKMGGADILAYVAGVMHVTRLEELTLEEWNRDLNINLTGALLHCRTFLPLMKKQGSGKIIFIGSIAAKIGGMHSGPHYSASKGGVHSLMKWIARDGAPDGVYVNCIAPGPLEIGGKVGMAPSSSGTISPESSPLGRLGKPEDIAEAAVFLTSPASNWITGSVLDVNGGILMD
ncbi:SDR family NAD(P)-dependent oxidoreductase [Chloroflexota bacterium]